MSAPTGNVVATYPGTYHSVLTCACPGTAAYARLSMCSWPDVSFHVYVTVPFTNAPSARKPRSESPVSDQHG